MLKAKLKSKGGDTIVETLCAFLIVILALTMLAQVIVKTCSIVKNTDEIRKNDEEILNNFWLGSSTTIKHEQVLDFEGFKISLSFDSYECSGTDGKSGEIYEFSEKNNPGG